MEKPIETTSKYTYPYIFPLEGGGGGGGGRAGCLPYMEGHSVPYENTKLQGRIERLHLTSPAVKQPKRPPLYSVSFIKLHDKVVISRVISETQAARTYEVLLCQMSLQRSYHAD